MVHYVYVRERRSPRSARRLPAPPRRRRADEIEARGGSARRLAKFAFHGKVTVCDYLRTRSYYYNLYRNS